MQIGEREVEGIELGIVGKLTDNWELSAGVAKMDTEIVRGLANQQRAADQLVARAHVHELDHLSHALRPLDWRWRALRGHACRARSITNDVPPPPDKTNMLAAPDYWVMDAMVGYAINDNVNTAAQRLQPHGRGLRGHAQQQRRALLARHAAVGAADGELHVLMQCAACRMRAFAA